MRKVISSMVLVSAILIPTAIFGHTKVEMKNARPGSKMFYVTSRHGGNPEVSVTEVPLTPSMKAAKKKAMEEKPLCPVTVIVDPSETTGVNMAQSVTLVDEKGIPWTEDGVKEKVIEVPAGTYLLEGDFAFPIWATVFIPEIKVDGPTEIHISRDMANISLTAQPLLMDGSAPTFPETDDDYNPTGDYNTLCCAGEYGISYNGISFAGMAFNFDEQDESYDRNMTIYTNLDSDKVRFCWSFNLEEPSNKSSFFYLTKTAAEAKENGTVSNDITLYRPFYADVKHSPIYAEKGNGNDGCYITFSTYFANNTDNSTFGAFSYSPREIWLCNDLNEKNGMYALVRWNSMDNVSSYIPEGTATPGACYDNGILKYFSTPETGGYAYPETPGNNIYPINELFSFQDFAGLEFGNSTPICITAENYIDWVDEPYSYMFYNAYIGNSGEDRIADDFLAEAEVKCGEEIVLPRGEYYKLFSWAAEWAAGDNAGKPLTYIFYDDNIEVYGLPGSNVCEVSVKGTGTDCCSPTLQRIMMKDLQGRPTIRFEKGEEGVLTLAGGDFIEHSEIFQGQYSPKTFSGYTYAPVSITVEYTPYKSDNYLPLEMTEVPENFFMPGYGAWWKGNLSQVSTQSENGWYDLRITLTDEAGNTQRQVLSPAFYIDKLSGISNTSIDKTFFRVIGGSIIADNGQEVTVYNVQGERVNNNQLTKGIYVATSGEKIAKIMVK